MMKWVGCPSIGIKMFARGPTLDRVEMGIIGREGEEAEDTGLPVP